MKVMVFVKATQDSEGGRPPDPNMMEAMGKYNEALIAAGILKEQVLGGLKPTRFAKRVHFAAPDAGAEPPPASPSGNSGNMPLSLSSRTVTLALPSTCCSVSM